MNIQQSYSFLFYRLYRFWEVASEPKSWSEAKSVISIIALEEFFLASLLAYYKVLIDPTVDLLQDKWTYFISGILIIASNCYYFFHRDRWKNIVNDFDESGRKNTGNIIVLLKAIGVVINFFVAFYIYLK